MGQAGLWPCPTAVARLSPQLPRPGHPAGLDQFVRGPAIESGLNCGGCAPNKGNRGCHRPTERLCQCQSPPPLGLVHQAGPQLLRCPGVHAPNALATDLLFSHVTVPGRQSKTPSASASPDYGCSLLHCVILQSRVTIGSLNTAVRCSRGAKPMPDFNSLSYLHTACLNLIEHGSRHVLGQGASTPYPWVKRQWAGTAALTKLPMLALAIHGMQIACREKFLPAIPQSKG